MTDETPLIKQLRFIGGSRNDLQEMPDAVRNEFGHGLWLVQQGDTPENAFPFEGVKATEVMKLSERYDGDTYRCVYAAKFEKAVYVLHVFQKKSKSGIATPQKDIDVVHRRLSNAKADYKQFVSALSLNEEK